MPAFTTTIASEVTPQTNEPYFRNLTQNYVFQGTKKPSFPILPGLPRCLFAGFRAQTSVTLLLHCTAGIVAYRARFENMRNDSIGT